MNLQIRRRQMVESVLPHPSPLPLGGSGGGVSRWLESCGGTSRRWEVQGFKARTLGSENSHPGPVASQARLQMVSRE